MKLSLGISPCPNDTFIFEALINKRIPTRFEWDIHFEDVQKLNELASKNQLNVSKLSYHAWATLAHSYQLLNAGSALGFGVGPLLITSSENLDKEISNLLVAIPGRETTAHFLLQYAFPSIDKKKDMLFSDIENAVLDGTVDAGVIIHENRFTYENKGLKLIQDLGSYWESKTTFPIPLGGIAVQKKFPLEIRQQIDTEIRQSLQFAFDSPEISYPFIQQYAQEMDPKVMQKHIDLYVNDFSLTLGDKGKAAIDHFLSVMVNFNIIDSHPSDWLLEVKHQ